MLACMCAVCLQLKNGKFYLAAAKRANGTHEPQAWGALMCLIVKASGVLGHIVSLVQQLWPSRGVLQVTEDRGQARVVYVAQRGPAERAGLAVGDTVLSLNSQPVSLADKRCAALPSTLSALQLTRKLPVAQRVPAERARLAVGDTVLSLNSQPVSMADKAVCPPGWRHHLYCMQGNDISQPILRPEQQLVHAVVPDLKLVVMLQALVEQTLICGAASAA